MLERGFANRVSFVFLGLVRLLTPRVLWASLFLPGMNASILRELLHSCTASPPNAKCQQYLVQTWDEQTQQHYVAHDCIHMTFSKGQSSATVHRLAPRRKVWCQSNLTEHLCGHLFCFLTVVFVWIFTPIKLHTTVHQWKSTLLCATSKEPYAFC